MIWRECVLGLGFCYCFGVSVVLCRLGCRGVVVLYGRVEALLTWCLHTHPLRLESGGGESGAPNT